jgi:hypothetical protein
MDGPLVLVVYPAALKGVPVLSRVLKVVQQGQMKVSPETVLVAALLLVTAVLVVTLRTTQAPLLEIPQPQTLAVAGVVVAL